MITIVICCAIIMIAVAVCIKRNKPSSYIQSVSTTLGVLGTFVGILLGLVDFDENNLTDSVPELIGGLKTAFVTSIVGMIVALLIKFFYKEEIDTTELTEKDVLTDILAELKVIHTDSERLSAEVQSVKYSVDDGFTRFAEEMAKQSTKELTEALKAVLTDFEVMVNDEVKEQMNLLYECTLNLAEWQIKHKEELEELHKLTQGEIQIRKQLNEAMDLVARTANAVKVMQNYLETLNKASEDIKMVVPRLAIITDRTFADLDKIVNQYEVQLEKTKAVSDEVNKSIEKFKKNLADTMNEFGKNLVGILKLYKDQIEEVKKRVS